MDKTVDRLSSEEAVSRLRREVLRAAETTAVAVERVLDLALIVVLVLDVCLELAQIIGQDFLHYDITWTPQAATLALCVITFLGGALAYRRGQFLRITLLTERLPSTVRLTVDAATDTVVLAISLSLVLYCLPVFNSEFSIKIENLPIAEAWGLLPLPVGILAIGLFAVARLFTYQKRAALIGSASGIGLVVAGVMIRDLSSVQASIVLLIAVAIGLALLILGMPVAIVLAAISIIYFQYSAVAPMAIVPESMQDGVSSSVLIAVPFFLVAGFIMIESKLANLLAETLMSIVGRIRHSQLYVIVLSMFVFSGISGSKSADMAAVGGPLLHMAKRDGYDPAEGVAVLSSSAVMGDTIPPSIALLVMSSISTLSAADLFAAGLLPAVLVGLCLVIAIAVYPHHERRVSARPWSNRTVLRGAPIIVIPILLIGGIVGGLATPTEASVLAVIYALLIAFVLYRSLSTAGFRSAFQQAASLSGSVLMLVATATVLSRAIALENVPESIVRLVGDLGGAESKWIFMILTILVLVVMGSVLEGLPAILMFAPILMPTATHLGIDPLQYAIVMILAMGLGAHTPPIGVGAYVACLVGEVKIESATRAIGRYLVFTFAGVLLVALVPSVSLLLPHIFGYTSP